jgi:hypothetical protein
MLESINHEKTLKLPPKEERASEAREFESGAKKEDLDVTSHIKDVVSDRDSQDPLSSAPKTFAEKLLPEKSNSEEAYL